MAGGLEHVAVGCLGSHPLCVLSTVHSQYVSLCALSALSCRYCCCCCFSCDWSVPILLLSTLMAAETL